MFEPTDTPRIFGLPPGVDFAAKLVAGLDVRSNDLSRTRIYVNTTRMQRRLRDIFDQGPARILPQIRLVTDLSLDALDMNVPPPIAGLRRRLELTQVISKLMDQDPSLAPRAALYDLADSLAALMDEMHGEGVVPGKISGLDVTDQSGHWQRALKFLQLLEPYFDAATDTPDAQARQRLIVTGLIDQWQNKPPNDPIIVAGSTGSRGATGLFMQAVARLPQGAVILPGFDTDMPDAVWDKLHDPMTSEDHPQYRFHKLLQSLGISHDSVMPWVADGPPAPARNQLISLSLRPAPVTDQWRIEGPKLGDLADATANMTYVEAASPRAEADAIALCLRQAAADGVTAALITPDRMLTRQVAAALDRWDIVPDDSAGIPLPLSAPGRFLRHVADLFGHDVQAEALLSLLKHPLCHTGHPARNTHLLLARELELSLRRKGPPIITPAVILDWSAKHLNAHAADWGEWLAECLTGLPDPGAIPLCDHLDRHLALAASLAAGPEMDGSGGLYEKAAGREAHRITDMLRRDADAGGVLSCADYTSLFASVLNDGVVRDRDAGDPRILIWGTLEARVGGAELLILGGMNDGTWPETPSPDPWLNRKMRLDAGLLLPERRIGLSAHDYQQAVAAQRVVITRAKRSADAETVPSRWVNRLLNLLTGLPETGGPDALAAMMARGDALLAQSAAFATPQTEVDKAKRPSPRPPATARPTQLSVTQIKTLIRDPYDIYARKVLRLNPLDPLQAHADGRLRGVIFHEVLEEYAKQDLDPADPATADKMRAITQAVLADTCPWPTIRMQWQSRMNIIVPIFLADEVTRRAAGDLWQIEARGEIAVGATGVTLTARADRIDQSPDGAALIYDYKTGQVPSAAVQLKFDKQLLLTAAMAERGAFDGLRMPVAGAAFLGINGDMKAVNAPLDDSPPDETWDNFIALLNYWASPAAGYTARTAMQKLEDESYFAHLSRYGEWTMADLPVPEDLS